MDLESVDLCSVLRKYQPRLGIRRSEALFESTAICAAVGWNTNGVLITRNMTGVSGLGLT